MSILVTEWRLMLQKCEYQIAIEFCIFAYPGEGVGVGSSVHVDLCLWNLYWLDLYHL